MQSYLQKLYILEESVVLRWNNGWYNLLVLSGLQMLEGTGERE